MPSCRELAEHASEYLDGELPLWRRLGFRLHLAICRACEAFLEQLAMTRRTLRLVGRQSRSSRT